jgi:hypothetical protein
MAGTRSVDPRDVSSRIRRGRRLILVGVGLIILSAIAFMVFSYVFFGAPPSEPPTSISPPSEGGFSGVVAIITAITALVGAVTGLVAAATGLVKVLRARGPAAAAPPSD